MINIKKLVNKTLYYTELTHEKVVDLVCGKHPYQNILHDEWLALKDIHPDIKKYAQSINGKVLDIGCGGKPYKSWFIQSTQYIGIDIDKNSDADYIIKDNQKFPLKTASFDCVVSFQTLEHVKNLNLVISEIDRILKPGGKVFITIPFTAYEHASPSDYRRFTVYGSKQLFSSYKILVAQPQGGIGSTIGAMVIAFWKELFKTGQYTLHLWMVLFPIRVLLNILINLLGNIVDKIDVTNKFYSNVLLIVKKDKSA